MLDNNIRAYSLVAVVVIVALAAIGCLYLECI